MIGVDFSIDKKILFYTLPNKKILFKKNVRKYIDTQLKFYYYLGKRNILHILEDEIWNFLSLKKRVRQ